MNVAFIPVRGGSKSIPLKNIKLICGKPLVYWSICAACKCDEIDEVYVATDSNIIKETVLTIKKEENFLNLFCIDRAKETATDTATTESAMMEFASKYEFDNIVLIQATSPLVCEQDLQNGFELLKEEADSILSVVRQKRFRWRMDDQCEVYPENYDYLNRPRRQEFEGDLVENGAFYITSKKLLLESGCRISGKIKAVEMSEESYFEIDEPSDFVIIEELLKNRLQENISLEWNSKKIKMFLTDCDGCLTDGGMYYSEKGDELKKFNTRDGMAFKLLKEKGIITGIITSERVDLNRRRAEKLRLDILEEGCSNKAEIVKKLCEQYNISLQNVVYIGDDINDLEVIKLVGYGCAPADAMEQIKEAAKYVTIAKGGQGVIREIFEKIKFE